MYKRKSWKRRRRLQLFISIVFGTGIIFILTVKGAMLLYAEKEPAPVEKRESAKMEENIEKVEYIENVECILQNPELPTGCEATAATMLLNAYGYQVDKMTVADYLEKSDKIVKDGTVYACYPDETFIGNPETSQGYGAFPKAVVKAMQKVIDKQDGEYEACALYGKTEEELLALVEQGKPVCIWASMENREIEYRRGWYLIREGEFTEEYFYWPSNEHVLVLTGYDETTVTVCDPMKGVCTYPRKSFFRHYEQVGEYAVVMEMRK